MRISDRCDRLVSSCWRSRTRGDDGALTAAENRAVDPEVRSELGVERRYRDVGLADEDRFAECGRENFDARTHLGDARGADEDEGQRAIIGSRLEAVELAAVGVARDGDLDEAQAALNWRGHTARGEDEARANTEYGPPRPRESQEGRLETEALDEREVHAAFAAGKNETIDEVEIGRRAHLDELVAEIAKRSPVRGVGTL